MADATTWDYGCWRTDLHEAMAVHGDSFQDIMATTLTDAQLDKRHTEISGGCPFTVWTERRVYFPTEYDGAEGVASVARHPDGVPTEHI